MRVGLIGLAVLLGSILIGDGLEPLAASPALLLPLQGYQAEVY
jgi:hypothetical protein